MNEFSQILRTAQRLVKGYDAELEVVQSFPDHPRSNPQSGCLAVVGIQKVSILPLGMNDYYGEQLMPFGKRTKVWLKVSFCCKSGEECWKLWERTASRLLFSGTDRVRGTCMAEGLGLCGAVGKILL